MNGYASLSLRSLYPVAALVCLHSPSVEAHPDPLENIKIYTYVLSISPENHYAYLNRGISCRMVSDFGRAIDDFNQAERMGVTGRYLWMNRAMAYVSLGRFDEAIEDLDRILELEPNDPATWFYRGEVFYRQKDFRKALSDYSKSLEIKEAAHVCFVRADAHRMLGELDAAIEDYTRAIRKRPYTTGFLIARAKCFALMKRYDEARSDLDEAERKQPERYQIYIERAILSASQSLEASKTADIKLALQYLEDELFFRPKDPQVFSDRAKVYDLSGEIERAREDFDRAVEYADPFDSAYLKLRAEFLERQGEREAARVDRDRAEEIDSKPVPTATPLPGPTLTPEEIRAQPTPNLLPGLAP